MRIGGSRRSAVATDGSRWKKLEARARLRWLHLRAGLRILNPPVRRPTAPAIELDSQPAGSRASGAQTTRRSRQAPAFGGASSRLHAASVAIEVRRASLLAEAPADRRAAIRQSQKSALPCGRGAGRVLTPSVGWQRVPAFSRQQGTVASSTPFVRRRPTSPPTPDATP